MPPKPPYLPVIKVPAKFQAMLEKSKSKKANRPIVKKFPVITSKRKEYNHYEEDYYEKFDKVPLVSSGWFSRKAAGDFFTIHRSNKDPSFWQTGFEERSFQDLGLHEEIVQQFAKLGIHKPTNIQRKAIPKILKGHNTVVAAETGNGKTYAFVAPIVQQLRQLREMNEESASPITYNAPRALIIVPGRELIMQTRDMARALADPFGIGVNSLVGSKIRSKVQRGLMRNTDILVSTLGVVSKMTTFGMYSMSRVQHVVLDEADTLLDNSFKESMMHYLGKIPLRGISTEDMGTTSTEMTGAQLTLVGATFPSELDTILKDVVEIDSLLHIKTSGLNRLPSHVQHTFHRVKISDKCDRLLQLCKSNYERKKPTIIFSNTSRCSDFVSFFLTENGLPCSYLNAQMPPDVRKGKFKSFKEGAFYLFSCTDVASRGLDTTWVTDVVNFECPRFMSDYIHRCGRTGRVGSKPASNVTTLVNCKQDQVKLVQEIEYAVRRRIELPNMDANIKKLLQQKAERREELEYLEKLKQEHMESVGG